jgi:hypothetical protein
MFGFARRRAERAAEAAAVAEAARIPALARELHWRTRAVRDAIVHRRLSYLVGVIMPIFGLGYLSLGILPAIRVGWDLSAQVHAGRGNGFTPLGFVLVATGIIGGLLIFAGIGSVVGAFSRVSQTKDQLVRFRINNEAELPQIEALAAELAVADEALAARIREERAREKRAGKKRDRAERTAVTDRAGADA